MKSIKGVIIGCFLLINLSVSAQLFKDGSYNLSSERYSNITIANRRNGTLMASFKVLMSSEKENIVFTPTKDNKSFTVEKDRRLWVLTTFKEVPCLLVLDDLNAIQEKMPFAVSKKELKQARKKLGVKSNFSKGFGGLVKSDKSKPKPKKKEYWVANPTSDFHLQNVGKIVFFSEEPTIGKEDMSKIKTDFKVGDEIWAILYLPTTFEKSKYIRELANPFYDAFGNTHYWLTVGMDKIDDQLLAEEKEVFNQSIVKTLAKKELKDNYVVFQFIPRGIADVKGDIGGKAFILERMGERLEPYKHELRIAMTDGNSKPEEEYFEGFITYDTSAGAESLITLSKNITEGALKAKKLPTPLFRDATLEKEMLGIMSQFAANKGWDDVVFSRAIISLNWQTLKDDFGGIIGNYVEAEMLYSSDEGCATMNVGFLKEYLGSGNYAQNIRQYTTGGRGQYHCDTLK